MKEEQWQKKNLKNFNKNEYKNIFEILIEVIKFNNDHKNDLS